MQTKVNLSDVIKVSIFIAGLLGTWYSMKYEVDYLNTKVDKLEKQLEDCHKQKTEAIRAYQGLAQMGKFAEEMGVDLKQACEDLPESEKNKYDFNQKHTVLESGRVKHQYFMKPKKNGKKPT